MENLKQMSVRINPDTLKKIDELLAGHRYWKRNSVINGVLTAVFHNFKDSEIYDMVRWDSYYHKETDAHFEIKK